MRFTSDHSDQGIDWPWWIPTFAAGVQVLVAVQIAIDRRMFSHLSWDVLLLFLIVTPYLLDLIEAKIPFRIAPAPWLFCALVIVPTTLMLLDPTALDFMPFFFVFLAAAMATRLELAGGMAVAGTTMAVMIGLEIAGKYEGAFIWCMGIGAAWFFGYTMHNQLVLTTKLREAQADLAQSAAVDERQRIAREVHDVIAHSLSVSMLHVTAARMALEKNEVRDAIDALQEAETQGRRSLSEVRRTVGLLGPDESAAALPLPGVVDLPRLAVDYQTAGVRIDLRIDADVKDLPSAASLNIYRIVQEALTNAVKHAPGCDIRALVRMEDDLLIRVQNDVGNGSKPRNETGAGMGLQSMAERAALLGGTLETADEADSYTVTVVAPRPTK